MMPLSNRDNTHPYNNKPDIKINKNILFKYFSSGFFYKTK